MKRVRSCVSPLFLLSAVSILGMSPLLLAQTTGRIVFDSYRSAAMPSQGRDIFIADDDGSNEERLTTHDDQDSHPAVCNPQTIVFRSNRDESGHPFLGDIFTMQPNGTNQTNIFPSPGTLETDPDCGFPNSPAQPLIVFTRLLNPGQPSEADIWRMEVDGSNLVNLTNSPGVEESHPQWCGKNIVYTSDAASEFGNIHIMGPNGENPRRLSCSQFLENQPTCSPDGKTVVFRRSDGVPGESTIYRLPICQGECCPGTVPLTDKPGRDEHPSYSPGGSVITFSSNRNGDSRVFKMDATDGEIAPDGFLLPVTGQASECALSGTCDDGRPHWAEVRE